jgi:Putative lumazine-binding
MESEKAMTIGGEDERLIQETLDDYIQGGSTGEIERLRRAFHPDAQVRSVRKGELVQWTLNQYLDIVAKAPLQQRHPEIMTCDREGDVGFAQLRLTYADFAIIDHFHLAKVGGKWLIVDKIFQRI